MSGSSQGKNGLDNREFASRRKRFRNLMDREGLDGLLVTHPPDVRYLCGFTGSSGWALLLGNGGYFLTDFRYRERSAEEVRGLKVVVCREGMESSLARILHRDRGKVVGFDASSISYAGVISLRRKLKGIASLRAIKGPLALLRARKSKSEVEIIRRAVRLAQEAFQEALEGYYQGIREKELAALLDIAARRKGAEGRSFEPIVASGARGAMAHAGTSSRVVKGLTVMDWGIVRQGYCTDMTRTLAFGRVSSTMREIHALVLEAQQRALEAIAPGVKARDVDRAAREYIDKAGYGTRFGHGLGHGVGLEVHERPHVSKDSSDVLEEGMIFTVEPGIYIPGKGGVRVEDMVLVTRRGMELLSNLPRGTYPSGYRN